MENGQTLIIRDIEQTDAGTYTCVAGLRGYKDKDKCSAELTVKGPPDPPRNVEILTCPGRHQAELIWEDGNNNGEEIVSYLVQYNSSMNPFYWNSAYDEVTPNDLKKSNSYFINLAPWGKYSFRVLAKNNLGYSEPSKPTPSSCDTPPSRPFGNPQNVATKTDKMGKLIITWDPMPRMLHNGPGLSYVVSYRHKGNTYWNDEIVKDPNENELEIDVDDIYGLYEVKVKAKNSFGESFRPPYRILGHSGEAEPSVSPEISAWTQKSQSVLTPPTLSGNLWIRLKKILMENSEDIWYQYKIQSVCLNFCLLLLMHMSFLGEKFLRYWKSSEGRRHWEEVPIRIEKFYPFQDVRATVNDLPPNTALRAQVSVMNDHYTGQPSDTIDFSTPEGVPGPVRSLREMEIKSNEAQLTWLPPDEPNGELVGYDIGYQPVNEESESVRALEPTIQNPSTLIATIIGLQPDQEYRFFVWARTNAGRGTPVSIDVRTKRLHDGPCPNLFREPPVLSKFQSDSPGDHMDYLATPAEHGLYLSKLKLQRTSFEIRAMRRTEKRLNQRSKVINIRPLSSLTAGILGVGQIGTEIARLLRSVGMTTWGLGRNERKHKPPEFNVVKTTNDMTEFLQSCDYLINVLPSTASTKNLLSGDTLKQCNKVLIPRPMTEIPSLFLNHTKKLKNGWLSGAILDVVNQEPLPQDSPLWSTPNVVITSHISGPCLAEPLADVFARNLSNYLEGKPLDYEIKWDVGY
ncbi:hypothetical protein FSP39_002402 [Pinctada imbricata]|uniref:Fibronectin type-III domain-containing protein n=1 Tax=Pinctada imbricata TaxID=66713 RepID=A0AA88YKD7_PINIB|nr:hypothetical protein FSP39_002402 [Pinctada imbricata]